MSGTSGLTTQLVRYLVGLHWSRCMMDTMDTVLFTDHGIVVFAITTSAIALMFSVLGLATTHRMRSDIKHQLEGLS